MMVSIQVQSLSLGVGILCVYVDKIARNVGEGEVEVYRQRLVEGGVGVGSGGGCYLEGLEGYCVEEVEGD
jgi:hypothetical protein